MRYKCYRCEQYIKDKFIFGLLHVCLTEDEYQHKLAARQMMSNPLNYKSGLLGSLCNNLPTAQVAPEIKVINEKTNA